MATLLFEVGCEELPASACQAAEAELPALCAEHLGKPPARLYVAPRRLAALVEDLPDNEPDEWVKGPPLHVGEEAAAGFARRRGVSRESLEERDGFLGVVVRGKPLRETLPQRIDAIVRGLVFPKTMRWDASAARFPRPIRWRCVKLDGETLERGASFGRRFGAATVEIPDAAAYAETLRAAGVEPDAENRRRLIVAGLDELGGWSDPAGVLDEVVYLVESPFVLDGRFDERFLELPRRVVETSMQSHQRYFPVEGARFAFVANGGDPETVVAGNERVLEGRLEDASFTFERDVAKGIEALADEIRSITFVAGAGTYADKGLRLQALVEALGGGDASREAARLAKADQAAELVREFPELEGHIGAEYARLAGYPEAVCAAIDEHHLPDSAGGPLPATETGRVVSAADKIDSLTVAFALGQRPSGSRDPYGLRRAAIGVCRLALEAGLEIDVAALVGRDRALLAEQGAELVDDASDVADFVLERLESLLDVPVEFVRAARAAPVAELGALGRLAQTLAAEAASEAFERAYVAYDRASRLANRADGAAPALDPRLATEEAELALIDALAETAPRVEAAVAARDFAQALEAAAELGPPVDRFFDEVLVMADDESVRANRLRLLLEVRDAVGALGDLSQIPR